MLVGTPWIKRRCGHLEVVRDSVLANFFQQRFLGYVHDKDTLPVSLMIHNDHCPVTCHIHSTKYMSVEFP